jgi:segregation and condensation protein A
MSTKFKVQTDAFEGPLELLLELIEARKLFINDVSLANVADDYIDYVKKHQEFPVSDIAHFVLVASTLLLIKSKSLLPQLELTEEESADILDLERRLKIYRRIRSLKGYVGTNFGVHVTFPREDSGYGETVFMPDESLTVNTIKEVALQLIQSFPTVEKLSKVVVEKVMSLEDMIARLTERVQKSITMNFSEFAESVGSSNTSNDERARKLNLTVSFLAMLELVKQGAIAVQ